MPTSCTSIRTTLVCIHCKAKMGMANEPLKGAILSNCLVENVLFFDFNTNSNIFFFYFTHLCWSLLIFGKVLFSICRIRSESKRKSKEEKKSEEKENASRRKTFIILFGSILFLFYSFSLKCSHSIYSSFIRVVSFVVWAKGVQIWVK